MNVRLLGCLVLIYVTAFVGGVVWLLTAMWGID